MSGFPTPLTSGQKATTRASGFWQRTLIACCPGDVVFQAEANEDITDAPFKTFAWTNTLQGLYTDVWKGTLVYISSSTTEPTKNFKYRGRVRLAPSATEFFIDLNATELLAGDIITVTRDADYFACVREGALLDGSVAYHTLPPVITGLPSVLPLYDSDDDNSVTYTPSQVGIAVEAGATIASYAWAISAPAGASSSISNAAIQHPLLTFEPGYMYLVRCTVTDSNGITGFQFMKVYAVAFEIGAPVIATLVGGNVGGNLDNGFNGTVTGYANIENLPYRTDAVVFAIEHFGDGDDTPIVTNVLMHGRLRSESMLTEGSAEAGRIKRVTFPIEGAVSYLQRLRFSNDIVRTTSTPNELGEINQTTVFRMLVYALDAYSNFFTLHSFGAGDNEFDEWRIGGEPVSIDGGYAIDVMKTLLDKIKAAANFAPNGEVWCEITASYREDRSGLVTIMDFLPTDARSIQFEVDTSRITGQVNGYGGSWNSANNTFILYTASAPTVPYGDAPEVKELTRELLRHDVSTAAASAELEARVGNDFAVNNPRWLIVATMRGAHRWLVATNYLRYTWQIPITDNLRQAITTATKLQCQSVDITINPDGTYEPVAQFVQETEFLNAQSIGGLLPINLEGMNPVLPMLSDDPAFPDDPLWMYPTDTPTEAELQPIGAYSAYLSYSPFSPDQAAQAAAQQPEPGCFVTQVNMRNSGTTNGDTTVNTDPYIQQISGFGQISAGGWSETDINFASADGNFIPVESSGNPLAVYSPPWTRVYDTLGSGISETRIEQTFADVTTWLTVRARVTSTCPTAILNVLSSGSVIQGTVNVGVVTNAWVQVNVNYTEGYLRIDLCPPTLLDTGDFVLTFHEIEVTGTGTNPFTSTPGTAPVFADWFYFWTEGEEETAQLFAATAGGLIDGAKPAVIPDYRADHRYENIEYIGSGNPLQLNFALEDYTDVQNKLLTVITCQNP